MNLTIWVLDGSIKPNQTVLNRKSSLHSVKCLPNLGLSSKLLSSISDQVSVFLDSSTVKMVFAIGQCFVYILQWNPNDIRSSWFLPSAWLKYFRIPVFINKYYRTRWLFLLTHITHKCREDVQNRNKYAVDMGIGIGVKFQPLTSMYFTRQCHDIISSHLPCLPTTKRMVGTVEYADEQHSPTFKNPLTTTDQQKDISAASVNNCTPLALDILFHHSQKD